MNVWRRKRVVIQGAQTPDDVLYRILALYNPLELIGDNRNGPNT